MTVSFLSSERYTLFPDAKSCSPDALPLLITRGAPFALRMLPALVLRLITGLVMPSEAATEEAISFLALSVNAVSA